MFVIPFFVSLEGCRRRCIYCDQSILDGHYEGRETVRTVVERYLGFRKTRRDKPVLAFYGGTFLNLSPGRMRELLDEARVLRDEGVIAGVRVSTTPESVTEAACLHIADVVDTVELGVQTFDRGLIRILNRSYDGSTIAAATGILRAKGIAVGYQLMAGLPFETFGSFAASVEAAVGYAPDFVRIYPLFVPARTPLSVYLAAGMFVPASPEDIVARGAYGLFRFAQSDIPVARVGLEGFVDPGRCAFSYAVDDWRTAMEAFLWRELILQKAGCRPGSRLEIRCCERNVPSIVGPGKKTVHFFRGRNVELNVGRDTLARWQVRIDGADASLFDLDWRRIAIDRAG